MSYTKCPWRVSSTKSNRLCVVGADGKSVVTSQGTRPIPEDEANARLIAAAPELLDALKLITAALHQYAGRETPLYEITQAKAAIKKAEGEQ